MKDLLRDVEFWIGFCITTFIISGALTITICMAVEDLKQVNMAKQGYEQVILPGSNIAKWQKAK